VDWTGSYNKKGYALFCFEGGDKNGRSKNKDDFVLALKFITSVLPIPARYFKKSLNIPERSTYYKYREGQETLR
jgi:hypothetical protein